ncbi:MAG: hypothetical protein ACRD0Q_04765 [Acidimicrobiales bacterium]
MILWPAGMAVALVWLVFRDPAFDHRLVVVGAVLPDLVDGPLGGARVLHTLVASAALLAGVMLATRGRRCARRRWLALPIGTFAHLVFDGAWADARTFWWPLFGWPLDAALPALQRGTGVLVLQETVGAIVLVWFWRRFGLGDAAVRQSFLRTGHLPRPDPRAG